MKNLIKMIATGLMVAMFTMGVIGGASGAEYTKGTIKKVNLKSKKVTIIHEELTNLGMPAMTMVFRLKDESMLEKMKAGNNIEFVAERVKGKLTVVELKQ